MARRGRRRPRRQLAGAALRRRPHADRRRGDRLSLWSPRLAPRPGHGAMTYGLKRAEILSAQVNGVTLLVLAVLIVFEAVRRLFDAARRRGEIDPGVALGGIVVNLAATWVLARANRESLNVEGSFQHILTDLYAFIGTAIAAAVILLDRLPAGRPDRLAVRRRADAARRLRPAARLAAGSSSRPLPRASRSTQVGRALAGQPGVVEVHDLHVWEVTSGFPSLSAHVIVEAGRRLPRHPPRARAGAARPLRDRSHDAPGRAPAGPAPADLTKAGTAGQVVSTRPVPRIRRCHSLPGRQDTEW